MKRLVFLVLIFALPALVGCGNNNETPDAGPSASESPVAPAVEGEEEIVIKSTVDLASTVDRGEVLDGSTLGGSPFCPSGTTSGGHGNTDNGWLDKTFECPDGTLTLAFDPRNQKKNSASGPWEVLSGTGAYEGVQGSGQMKIKFAADPQVLTGHESFIGTLSH